MVDEVGTRTSLTGRSRMFCNYCTRAGARRGRTGQTDLNLTLCLLFCVFLSFCLYQETTMKHESDKGATGE